MAILLMAKVKKKTKTLKTRKTYQTKMKARSYALYIRLDVHFLQTEWAVKKNAK